MLHTVMPFKRFCHCALAALHARVAKSCQSHGIPLSGQNRIKYPETAQTGNVAEYTMNLKVHLVQRLLYVQDTLVAI